MGNNERNISYDETKTVGALTFAIDGFSCQNISSYAFWLGDYSPVFREVRCIRLKIDDTRRKSGDYKITCR